jgi:histidinol-phosphatase
VSTIIRHSVSDLLAFALSLADAADAVSMRHYRTDHAVERKADGSFVTPGDLEIEALLRERIAEAFPDHAVLGEEEGDAGGTDAEARWIVDPIDGTHNFMRGVPVWAILIAVERGGAIEVGVVSAPALGTRWWAGRGLGAYRGATGGRAGAGERIRVSDLESLDDTQIFVGDLVATLDRWRGARALLGDAWRVRAPGDFWGFCLVAEGAADVMLEGVDLAPWDIAALIPIVEEAGGRLTDGEGGSAPGAGPRVASNGRLHDEVMRRLAGSGTT